LHLTSSRDGDETAVHVQSGVDGVETMPQMMQGGIELIDTNEQRVLEGVRESAA
jgi:hypothetical protein